MLNQTYVLDMTPGGMPVRVPVSQYDDTSRDIVFSLVSNGTPFSVPPGADVTCDGTKPDSKAFMVPSAFSGSTVTVTITEQMAAVAGDARCQITIRSGGSVLGSANFTLAVERGAISDDSVISDSDMSAIAKHANDAIKSAQEAAQSAAEAKQSVLDVKSQLTDAEEGVQQAITNAGTAKTSLESTISSANTAKTNLEGSISTAEDTKTDLDATNQEASDLLTKLLQTHGGYYTPSVDTNGNISWTSNYENMPDIPAQNIKGPKGDTGDTGATFTPAVSSAGVLSWSNDKGISNPAPVNIKGPKGDKGETGSGLTILGYYDSMSALQSAVTSPAAGMAYGVGTAAPYDVYIYDPENGWVNNGPIQGAKGDKGDTGATFTPSVSEDGTLSWTNDKDLENPRPVNIKGSEAFEIPVTLPMSGWADGAQTAQNAALLVSGYSYIVTPAPASHGEYAACMVYADDITMAGQITFHCEDTPTKDLSVSILRIEVDE